MLCENGTVFQLSNWSTAADSTSAQSTGAAPQTYIVAQNPLVLAHLLRENQSRALDPQAYVTPASVFNTVSVDFAETLPENPNIVDKIIHPKPDEILDIPLQTNPMPAHSLHKLDPMVPEETLTVVVGAKDSCDNLCQNPAVEEDAEYPSRVRSLERNPRGLSTAERAPVRMGSLERNNRGSLSHRGSPVPIAPFTRQHSVPASPPRSRRDQDVGQFSVQGTTNAQLAASVVNKMRTQPEPPLVEEIYDFGGDNVKSCVAIAAQKAMCKPYRPTGAAMSASHPTSYNVPVGIVQGVPYSQSPKSKMFRSGSPQFQFPQAMPPYMQYNHNVVQGPQPMLYRPQVATQSASQFTPPGFQGPSVSTAGFQPQARPQFSTAQAMDAPYESRQECLSNSNFQAPRPQFSAASAMDVQYASRQECSSNLASNAGFQGQSRPQFGAASAMDAQYASRQECSPSVQASTQVIVEACVL